MDSFRDPIPIETINSLALFSKQEAIKEIHQPSNSEKLAKARKRLRVVPQRRKTNRFWEHIRKLLASAQSAAVQ